MLMKRITPEADGNGVRCNTWRVPHMTGGATAFWGPQRVVATYVLTGLGNRPLPAPVLPRHSAGSGLM